MKKTVKILSLVMAAFMLITLAFTSCNIPEDNSGLAGIEINASSWKKTYFVGDQLSLDGLKVRYFTNMLESSSYEEIAVTQSMVSGFSTASVGTFNMTVTYKGKTDTVQYKVVEKADVTVNAIFCLGENLLVKIDSTAMKATVYTYDNYFKVLKNEPSNTATVDMTLSPNSNGDSVFNFNYNNMAYKFWFDKQLNKYSVSNSVDGAVQTRTVNEISFDAMLSPKADSVYKSEVKDGKYYSVKVDGSFGLTVSLHEVAADGTVNDTVLVTYSANDAKLSVNGALAYSKADGGANYYARMMKKGEFSIRKDNSDATTAYSAVCTLAE